MVQAPVRAYIGIDRLYSLSRVARKQARHVQREDLNTIEHAALVEQGGQILWVGELDQMPQVYRSSESVDLGGAVILPALIECHTHLIYSGTRSHEFDRRLNGETYREIAAGGGGIQSTVRATREATDHELLVASQKRANSLIRQGVSTIEIKSGYGLDDQNEFRLLEIAKQITPRVVRTYLGAHAIPSGQSSKSVIQHLVQQALPEIARRELADRVDIFVDDGFFTVAEARECLTRAKMLGLGLALHADQLTRTGATELAVELGAQSADHILQVSDDDVARLAASEVTGVLLPTADLYMNCDYPRARALIDAGVRVALASDHNPGTSPTLDVSLVGLLARIEMRMSLAEVLAAYTVGAAHALGLEKKLGSLEVGKCADFIAMGSDIDALFYSAGAAPDLTLFSEGRVCTEKSFAF